MCARVTLLVELLSVAGLALAAAPARRTGRTFTAVAHSVEGKSADGSRSRPGTVAADPSVLPLGSRIRVRGAGKHSGLYTVVDSGVKGNVIDIYVSSAGEARAFGRRKVQVEVLEKGR